ncbi:glycine betaine ABC transporter substrate-binding protein [Marinitenerispora sediminis]|uniref:Glycine/betaine ABC transporter substrate-binding protein n=1 Tax=Marinitenerispora sediminis TaxID=1931232 RepID=A0A368T4B2_9ACTN|nr:glycine betaine ABC transporter substrate-binding protein [Marinitenerispora sediminis]RCV49694.1 glycine/betaine ABC transporter substrate-binding protein [Marinitenerispora sediminis]RCV53332.1 glycine/betaine ABC transporter substrate-binding protein [Marinitenerispora sediminis]RCV57546.1 glycine/betaine ABC transporter substrate-binding protein [Marinitenerispora sediminis]
MERSGRTLGLGAAVAALALVATACNGEGGGVATGPEDGGGAGQEISIGMIPWEEDIAVTNLWKVVLEEQGYDVTIENVDVAPLYEGMARGDVDLFLDTWLPDTHADYWENYQDQLEDIGVWYDNATLELTVPSYVEDVDSIEDLRGREDEFGGEIVGIEAGSGLVRTVKENAVPAYGLEDYQLVESSTAAMLTELESAINAEEPIVVTLWRPHIAYAQYDLKDLEDPEGAMGEGEEIHMVGRAGFGADFPELNGWLQNFKLSDEQLGELEQSVLVDHKDDEEEGARAWLRDNPDYLQGVMGEAAADLTF